MNQPKREKAARTKQELMVAARELFYAKGIFKTSVSDIVKRAGVAKGTFYLYFETKDDMVKAIVDETLNHYQDILRNLEYVPVTMEAVDVIIDRLTGVLKEQANPLRNVHNIRFLSYFDIGLMKSGFINNFAAHVKSWLDRGVSSGLIDIPDTGFYSIYILVSFHEMIDMALDEDSPFSLDQLGFHMKRIIRKIIFMVP